MVVEVRHEAGVEVGTVTGWTHSDRYGDLPLVSVDWRDGTNCSVSLASIVGVVVTRLDGSTFTVPPAEASKW